jgi:hypothetical protein
MTTLLPFPSIYLHEEGFYFIFLIQKKNRIAMEIFLILATKYTYSWQFGPIGKHKSSLSHSVMCFQ